MIKSFVGPMFSGKSDRLITLYNNIYRKDLVVSFKPNIDSRDGAYIKTRNSELSIPAICIENLDEIPQYVVDKGIRTVLIDEAEFLNGDVQVLVDLSVIFDIDFYIAGLNMTSEQKPFGIMPDILAVSDEIENVAGFCCDCNRPSIYTYYENEDKDSDVLVGDSGYLSLCPSCLRKRKQQSEAKILWKKEK